MPAWTRDWSRAVEQEALRRVCEPAARGPDSPGRSMNGSGRYRALWNNGWPRLRAEIARGSGAGDRSTQMTATHVRAPASWAAAVRALADRRASCAMEDRFDTDIDVRSALTDPRQVSPHWLGEVERASPGPESRAPFQPAAGKVPGVVEACGRSRSGCSVLTRQACASRTRTRANRTIVATHRGHADRRSGDQTILVIERTGHAPGPARPYGAGVQVQVEDLAPPTSPGVSAPTPRRGVAELIPAYQDLAANAG